MRKCSPEIILEIIMLLIIVLITVIKMRDYFLDISMKTVKDNDLQFCSSRRQNTYFKDYKIFFQDSEYYLITFLLAFKESKAILLAHQAGNWGSEIHKGFKGLKN